MLWLRNCTAINHYRLTVPAENKGRWMWRTLQLHRGQPVFPQIKALHRKTAFLTAHPHPYPHLHPHPPCSLLTSSAEPVILASFSKSVPASGIWYRDISLCWSFFPLKWQLFWSQASVSPSFFFVLFLFSKYLGQSLESHREHKYMGPEQRHKYTEVPKLEPGNGWVRSGLAYRSLAPTGLRKFLNLCESQLQINNANAKLSSFATWLQNSESTGSDACESILKSERKEGHLCCVERDS